jgi:hypothetical protein
LVVCKANWGVQLWLLFFPLFRDSTAQEGWKVKCNRISERKLSLIIAGMLGKAKFLLFIVFETFNSLLVRHSDFGEHAEVLLFSRPS